MHLLLTHATTNQLTLVNSDFIVTAYESKADKSTHLVLAGAEAGKKGGIWPVTESVELIYQHIKESKNGTRTTTTERPDGVIQIGQESSVQVQGGRGRGPSVSVPDQGSNAGISSTPL